MAKKRKSVVLQQSAPPLISSINVIESEQGVQIGVFFAKGAPNDIVRMLAHDAIEDACYVEDPDDPGEDDDGGGEPVVPSTAAGKGKKGEPKRVLH